MTRNTTTALPPEAEMRSALERRDAGYDGEFFYGVTTTGVYCLPSCAARPARPEHVRIYPDPATAEAAGLRPCRRCRPHEAAEERARLVELARWIEANAAQPLTLADLARRVDMSPDRLKRRFRVWFGVSPKAHQDAARVRLLKSALADGEPVTASIFEAGFGSTSRVYGRAARHLGMTPSAYRSGGRGETILHACRQSVLGWLMLAATDKGVCCVQFGDTPEALIVALEREFPNATLKRSSAEHSPELDTWIEALDRHLSNDAPRPDLPLDLRGTAFQIRVWRYLLDIPAGEAIGYGELATGIGQPRAVRAAAQACGANRIAVLVPCHRVLRGDGTIGGYRWGVQRKRALLAAEHARASQAGSRRDPPPTDRP
jgi:AraC family transcriptional regulator of adaptative response/methylated-DNA-[protein]-cysteine methyltransferase